MRAPHFRQPAMLSGLVGAVALFGLASCSTTVASAPSQPAFDSDVRPIFMAHCVRCHGAGDALNVPTNPTGPDAAVPANINVTMYRSYNLYLNQYALDNGQCGGGGDGGTQSGCKYGALKWAGLIWSSLTAPASSATHMPPAPAPDLDDWEKDVIHNWTNEKPTPVCSNASDPDPTICPPGS
ncbi:MAG TPA: hypothetical protein VHO67_07315 [Polyangia bacterium]|nr:hypothetical protein [Polyangia bacterium]